MKRREFLKFGTCGLAGIAAGAVSGLPGWLVKSAYGEIDPLVPTTGPIRLQMEEALFEMVDGILVYHWAYRHLDDNVPDIEQLRIPGITIFATEGELVRVEITNNFPSDHTAAHSWAIPGIVDSGPIARGETARLSFRAPAAGTYFYLDPINDPVNRAMGLHGAFIVMPRVGNTPYTNPTAQVQKLFDDLGSPGWAPGKGSTHFPGHPWDPAHQFIWMMGTADPVRHNAVRQNNTLAGATFKANYLCQYFMMNGRAGFFCTEGPDLLPKFNVGQPVLIRYMNAGMYNHAAHIHGNHNYVLAQNNSVYGNPNSTVSTYTDQNVLALNFDISTNIAFLDELRMRPGDRKDCLVPFIAPPDIPFEAPIDFANTGLTLAERAARLQGTLPNIPGTEPPIYNGQPAASRAGKAWPPVEEPFPIVFPMHCHSEPSQTAAGGNYPQGVVTHFGFTGDIDTRVTDVFGANRSQILRYIPGIDGVCLVDAAEFHLKVNKVRIEGRYSGLRGTVLEVFAGPTTSGPGAVKVGQCTVGSDGRWAFRGRALAAAANRMVSLRALPDASFGADAASFKSERLAVRLKLV